jgi:halimadienyl-diphosphate synthase
MKTDLQAVQPVPEPLPHLQEIPLAIKTAPLLTRRVSGSIQLRTRALLSQIDQKTFSSTAYDTAWVSRVTDQRGIGCSSFPQALDWLRQHQLPNGSWGSDIEYFHDRILSTLSAIVALAEVGNQNGDRKAIQRGERYIWEKFDALQFDPHDTVGFELILPTLFEQARELGLDLPYAKCDHYKRVRSEKLSMIPAELLYSRKVSSTHSLEFMGKALNVEALQDLQETNGSFGYSPAATAYVLTFCPSNLPARKYLADALSTGGGAAMSAHPVEVFNKSWILYNFDLTGNLSDYSSLTQPHLEHLWRCWDSERGVGFSRHYPVPDLDDTAVVFKLLRRAGYPVNPDVFLRYEKETHFTCYTFERNPSIGANVHLLDALNACLGYEHRQRMVKKILRFLRSTRIEDAYWSDKWHISPYYMTSHAITALIGFDRDLARDAVQWIVSTQRPDGSWGYFRPTCEETAYCLQALITYRNLGGQIDESCIYHAVDYLVRHMDHGEMPAMWIEKCLYVPVQIVESSILGALAMCENL